MKTETEVIETTTELAKLVKINTEFIRILLVTIDNGIVSEQKELIGAVDNLKTIVKEADYKKVETAIISEFQKLIDDNSELNINIDSFLYHAQAKRDKATFALTKKEELNTSSKRFILESFNDVANPIREYQEEQRQLEIERVAREKELQEIEIMMILKQVRFISKNINISDISSIRDGIAKVKKVDVNNLKFAKEDALNDINDMIDIFAVRERELIMKEARDEELRKGKEDFNSKLDELSKEVNNATTVEELNTLRDRLETLSNSDFSNPLHIQEMEMRINYRDRDIDMTAMLDTLREDLNEIIEDTEKTDKVIQYLEDNGLFEF